MNLKSLLHSLFLLPALAACGLNDDKYVDVERDALEAVDRVIALGISEASGIPTADTAQYSGYMGATDWAGNAIVGEMSMSINFASDEVSGSARGFVDTDDINYNGSLEISGGSINRSADPVTEWQLQADVGGVISDGEQNTLVQAIMLGDFHGDTQQGILGVLEGTATNREGTAVLSGDNTLFVGEKR